MTARRDGCPSLDLRSAQRCVELIEALVRETKNQTSKKFYCPRAFWARFWVEARQRQENRGRVKV